ncbi:MAG: redoxin family protein [Verrucomicrobiota bacterium]
MLTTLFALVLAASATLTVGSKAPPIAVDAWIKGEPVTEFKPGTISVVEFWATWCGPCRASIPHQTQLQKDNPGVQFIAVAANERKKGETDTRLDVLKKFVAENGDAMGYRIAYDGDRDMGKTWMDAAGAEGFPTVFIVGKDGAIEWFGLAMEMDKPLAAVVAGTWDRAKAKQAADAGETLSKLISAAHGDYTQVLTKLDELIKSSPDNTQLQLTKFLVLGGEARKFPEAMAVGKQLISKNLGAEQLNMLAWFSATQIPKEDRDLDFSLTAAEKAVSASKSADPAILDTLARIYWERGDKVKALATQKQAVELGVKKDIDNDALAEMKESLEKYQGAVASAKE